MEALDHRKDPPSILFLAPVTSESIQHPLRRHSPVSDAIRNRQREQQSKSPEVNGIDPEPEEHYRQGHGDRHNHQNRE
jgi:hypothetical protein